MQGDIIGKIETKNSLRQRNLTVASRGTTSTAKTPLWKVVGRSLLTRRFSDFKTFDEHGPIVEFTPKHTKKELTSDESPEGNRKAADAEE